MKFIVKDDPRSSTCRIVQVRESGTHAPSEAYSFRRLDPIRRFRAASLWTWASGLHRIALDHAGRTRILAWMGFYLVVVLPLLALGWMTLVRNFRH